MRAQDLTTHLASAAEWLKRAQDIDREDHQEVILNQAALHFLDRLLHELFGNDPPSALGKALRVWVPVVVAYSYGVLGQSPTPLVTAFALYAIAGSIVVLRRHQRAGLSSFRPLLDGEGARAAARLGKAISAAQEWLTDQETRGIIGLPVPEQLQRELLVASASMEALVRHQPPGSED
jgi:hypothetical protein